MSMPYYFMMIYLVVPLPHPMRQLRSMSVLSSTPKSMGAPLMLVYNAYPLPTDCLFSRVIRPQAVICYRPPCHGIRMCLRFLQRVMVSSRRVAINKYDDNV